MLRIILACMHIHEKIGGGWPAQIYAELLEEALTAAGIRWEQIPLQESALPFAAEAKSYWCNDRILVHLTTRNLWSSAQEQTFLAQLNEAEIPFGILVNFGFRDLFVKRVKEGKIL
jgi:GxxExxY protein